MRAIILRRAAGGGDDSAGISNKYRFICINAAAYAIGVRHPAAFGLNHAAYDGQIARIFEKGFSCPKAITAYLGLSAFGLNITTPNDQIAI